MSKNLFDFASESIHSESKDTSEEKLKQNIDQDTLSEASRLYDKYKDYSAEDLSGEFVNLSKQRLKDGSLTKERLSSTLSSLSPFLSTSQRDFLSGLLGKIDE